MARGHFVWMDIRVQKCVRFEQTSRYCICGIDDDSIELYENVRLQEAQRLLRETDLPIAEIAERVGYANPGHFSVAFHESFSMTPSEYKKIVRTGR